MLFLLLKKNKFVSFVAYIHTNLLSTRADKSVSSTEVEKKKKKKKSSKKEKKADADDDAPQQSPTKVAAADNNDDGSASDSGEGSLDEKEKTEIAEAAKSKKKTQVSVRRNVRPRAADNMFCD